MTQPYVLNAGDANRSRVLANCIAFLQRLPAEKSWLIEVSPHRKERTSKQNRTLYGVAEATLAAFCGYRGADEKKALHLHLCGSFWGWRDDGLGLRLPIRTTTKNERGERDVIDTATAADFFEHIRQLAAEIGCDISDPDPMRGRP